MTTVSSGFPLTTRPCLTFSTHLASGFNEEAAYDAADYRTIYTLVGNSKQRSVGDLFKRALMAAYLLKILVNFIF